MKITVIAIGKRMPDWVNQGFFEYANRLPKQFALELIEIPLQKRSKQSDLTRVIQHEGEQMLQAIPTGNTVIALDVLGKSFDTQSLSAKLGAFRDQAMDITLLIGGPEGLAPACLSRADVKWSLSQLTLPHPLVRVLLAEQLYRAWTLLIGHPYHRD